MKSRYPTVGAALLAVWLVLGCAHPPMPAADRENEAPCAEGVADADMVVVPGGVFDAAASSDAFAYTLAPRVLGGATRVATFALDRTEVTVAAFGECIDGGPCGAGATSAFVDSEPAFCSLADCATLSAQCNFNHRLERARHPINCVDWRAAEAFCRWRGKRLPTHLEWEYVAVAGPENRMFPWGNAEPNRHRLNYGVRGSWATTAPVSSYPALPWGISDMAGNVSEWTSSLFVGRPADGPPGSSPSAPASLALHEGSNFRTVARARLAYAGHEPLDALPLTTRLPEIGFRCARTISCAKPIEFLRQAD